MQDKCSGPRMQQYHEHDECRTYPNALGHWDGCEMYQGFGRSYPQKNNEDPDVEEHNWCIEPRFCAIDENNHDTTGCAAGIALS